MWHSSEDELSTREGGAIHTSATTKTATASPEDVELSSITKIVTINPGKLGISIVFEEESGSAIISGISEACTFGDKVRIGDQIVTIDGKEIANSDDLRAGNDRVRKLGIIPTMDDDGDSDGDGAGSPKHHASGAESSDDDDDDNMNILSDIAGAKRKCEDDDGICILAPARDQRSISAPDQTKTSDDDNNAKVPSLGTKRNFSEIFHNGRWECGKCDFINERTKARCSKCQAWKGGKRANMRKKRKMWKGVPRVINSDSDEKTKKAVVYSDSGDESLNWTDDDDEDSITNNNKALRVPSLQIAQCSSITRLERHEILLEELIRSKTDELERVKRRMAHIRAFQAPTLVKCTHEGCINMTHHGGVCSRHAQTQVFVNCSIEGCTNQAVGPEGICPGHQLYKHGSYKKVCAHEGCNNRAKAGGLCMRHNTNKPAYWYCKIEGCTKRSQKGGLCVGHGAKLPRCSVEGCDKDIKRGRLCSRHQEKPKCSVEGCEEFAKRGRTCAEHRKR